MKKVSIIIPLYNAEEHIVSAVGSALDQTWDNKEIIVVNDGSTDNSLQVALDLEGPALKVIDQQNKGVCSARNTGFNHATGDFIQYLDADDVLSPDKIEHQMKILDGSSGISHCPWSKFYHDPKKDALPVEDQAINQSMVSVEWLVSAWEGGGMMQTGCWLTHRDIIEKAGPWNEQILMNNDGEFFCRAVLAAGKVSYSDKSLAYYRVPIETNVSQQKSDAAYSSLLNSYQSYEDHILSHKDSKEVREALANNYYGFIYQVSPSCPELIEAAFAKLKRLDVSKRPNVGGGSFKKMMNILGFKQALKVRDFMSKP